MKTSYFETTKDERRELLNAPVEEKIEITKNLIRETLSKAKKPIVQFSGGADSCALAWFVYNIDPNVMMVFHDWGLFLPRTRQFCEEFFKKYNMNYMITDSGYNYQSFLKEKGLPLFKGFHPFLTKKDYSKYHISEDCRRLKDICWKKTRDIFHPDYYFVGITAWESPQRKSIFINYGFVQPKKWDTISVKPLALFKKSEIFHILKSNNILWEQASYEYEFNGELIKWHEDCENKQKQFDCFYSDLECFMCLTRFKSKGWGRFGRLARTHPKEFREVMDMGIKDSMEAIIRDFPKETQYVRDFLDIYYYKTKKE